MKRNFILLSIITLFTVSTAYSQMSQVLGFFTMRQGIEKAKQTAIDNFGMTNPQLVNSFTLNNEMINVPMIGSFQIEFIYEGEDIGKANAWLYSFVEAGNINFTGQIGVLQVIPMGGLFMGMPLGNPIDFGYVDISYANPIDLEQLIDSDEFMQRLSETSLHSEMQDICFDPNTCISIIGVGAVATAYNCLQPEEIVWLRIVETADKEFCCKTPYNDASLITCVDYSPPTLEFFLMSEGIEVATEFAKEVTGNNNPILVAALYLYNGMSFTLWDEETQTPLPGNYKGSISFEGENIGKANIWLYHFVNGDDPGSHHIMTPVAVIKTNGETQGNRLQNFYWQGFFYPNVQNIPIDLENFEDSDVFIKKFVETDAYIENKEALVNSDIYSEYSIGIISTNWHTDCFQEDKNLWVVLAITEIWTGGGYEGFCCSAPPDNVDELTCTDIYVGIVEKEKAFPISIFPTPATNTVTINNPEELLINSITVYDILGNKVAEFSSDTVEINISNFPAGNYFICFTVGNKKIYRSLVVNK